MQFRALLAGLLAATSVVVAAPFRNNSDPEVAAAHRITALHTTYNNTVFAEVSARHGNCSAQTIQTRKEWSTLSPDNKKSFISAIHCLNALPSKTPRNRAPGARTRYDDFVVTHIELTPSVHASGLFLPFHRYFVHLFEHDLREQCNFTGPFPYWDWTLSYSDPRNASVFDGSELSLGGNGVFVAGHEGKNMSLPGGFNLTIPPATGGGCVASGPFTKDKFLIRLGPVGFEPLGPDGGMGFNPRCLKRDFNPDFSRNTSPSKVLRMLEECKDVGCVNELFDIPDGVPGGVHAAGHWQVGVDMLDPFASPNDPVFWLHHASVDRVWTIWQGLAPAKRNGQVWGTSTAANIPPSPPVTLDTMVEFGILAPPKPIRELISTIDGVFCYVYN